MQLARILTLSCLILVFWTVAQAQPDLPPEPGQGEGLAPKLIKSMESLQVSPDGKLIAVTFSSQRYIAKANLYAPIATSIQVWDIASGQRKWEREYEGSGVLSARFSPDSRQLFFSWVRLEAPNKTWQSGAELREPSTGRVIFFLELKENEWVRNAFFTPDGSQLIGSTFQVGVGEGGVRPKAVEKWNARSGKLLRFTQAVPAPDNTLDFFPNGQQILTQTTLKNPQNDIVRESKLAVLRWPELTEVDEIAFQQRIIGDVAFSPDGNRLALGSHLADETNALKEFVIHVWDIDQKRLVPMELTGDANTRYLRQEFTRDGKTLTASGYVTHPQDPPRAMMYFWNAKTGELLRSFEIERNIGEGRYNTNPLTALAMDGKTFYVANTAAKVEQRSLQDGALIRIFELRNTPDVNF